jgi:EmrB/QacA subfamily drug resistance transporter
MNQSAVTPKQVRWIVFGLMLGLLLSALDQTIIATAMPTVIRDLNGLNLYSWVFSIYMLTSTTGVPIFGKLADLFGRRLIYLIGMGLFILGSALCGLSQNMSELIIFRAIQGLGAGALMPISMTIIGDLFPPDKRGKMQGLFGAVFGLSSVIGPAVGGFLTDNISWHWIFYINLPFGILSAIVLGFSLKETKGTEKRPIDWFGAITLSGSIIALLLALVLGGDPNDKTSTHYAWGSAQIIGLFAACLLLLGVFLWIESKVREPILPLQLFKLRAISVSNIVGFLMGVGMFGAISYIPLFVQGVIGASSSHAGYILTPLMLSMIAMSIVGGRLVTKMPYRNLLLFGMAVMAIGFYLLSQMDIHTTNTTIVLYMILIGIGMGPLMPTLTIAVQSSVGREMRGVATSSSQFFRSIGGTMGVSILGAVMTSKMTSGMTEIAASFKNVPADMLQKLANPQALLSPELRKAMPPEMLASIQGVLANAIDAVFWVGLFFLIVGVAASLLMGKARLNKEESGYGAQAEAHGTRQNEAPKVELEML